MKMEYQQHLNVYNPYTNYQSKNYRSQQKKEKKQILKSSKAAYYTENPKETIQTEIQKKQYQHEYPNINNKMSSIISNIKISVLFP